MSTIEQSQSELTESQRREIARIVSYEVARVSIAHRAAAVIGASVSKSIAAAAKIIDAATDVSHGR